MSENSDNSIAFGMGILGGVLAGIALGVIYAPQPGKQTRQELKETIDEIKKNIKLEDTYGDAHQIELIDKLKYKFEYQINKINQAIKASKLATAKERESASSDTEY